MRKAERDEARIKNKATWIRMTLGSAFGLAVVKGWRSRAAARREYQRFLALSDSALLELADYAYGTTYDLDHA